MLLVQSSCAKAATYQLERFPEPERLAKLLRTIPDAERMFLYASGYPRMDWEEPEAVAKRIPEDWRRRVLVENAEEFYRWPGQRAGEVQGVGREQITGLGTPG